MSEIRLLTFDLDNTLWDVGQVIRHAEQQMYGWLDEVVPEYRSVMTQDVLLELRQQVVDERPELGHDVSGLREAVLFKGMQRIGLGDREAAENARLAFQAFFDARQEVVFFEHALEALAELARDYQLAALTNGNAHVGKIGLDRYFTFAYSSADVSASKPAPDIFHAALDRAGVHAYESIHIGDHLVDDIHGAGSVGMHTIWVNHGSQGDAEGHTQPTAEVEHLRDLPEAVRRIHDG